MSKKRDIRIIKEASKEFEYKDLYSKIRGDLAKIDKIKKSIINQINVVNPKTKNTVLYDMFYELPQIEYGDTIENSILHMHTKKCIQCYLKNLDFNNITELRGKLIILEKAFESFKNTPTWIKEAIVLKIHETSIKTLILSDIDKKYFEESYHWARFYYDYKRLGF